MALDARMPSHDSPYNSSGMVGIRYNRIIIYPAPATIEAAHDITA